MHLANNPAAGLTHISRPQTRVCVCASVLLIYLYLQLVYNSKRGQKARVKAEC